MIACIISFIISALIGIFFEIEKLKMWQIVLIIISITSFSMFVSFNLGCL
jgi:hypothetical protein